MPIPGYERIMLPYLKFLSDSKEHPLSEVLAHVYSTFELTEQEKKQLLPSGTEPAIRNRVRWASLLETTRRGYYKITDRGLEVLRENPPEITVKYLERFPQFVKFKTPRKEKRRDTTQKPISGTLVPPPITPKHNDIRDMIREIGQIEGKVAEVEYPIDSLRLDVVWKKITAGNPQWAFEVQMGGNFYEALTKLKHAWDKWNCKPFLVTTDHYVTQAKSLLEGSFHEMREDARIVNWEKIVRLCQLLRDVHKIRSEIRF
jgi:hypothetical protein